MKKVLYLILLIAELFVDSMLMISLWNSSLYIPIAFSIVAVAGLLIWQLVRFVTVPNPILKRNIWRNIVLILLIPSGVFFITYIVVAIAIIIAFA